MRIAAVSAVRARTEDVSQQPQAEREGSESPG